MSISILIPSFNTPKIYIDECIKSILEQDCINNYQFEIVWVNDGSIEKHSLDLENSLELFKTIPTIKVVYKKLSENKGIVDALNIGLDLCSSELIFRMDSDDIMFPSRIRKQIDFMEKNPQCMICGTLIREFKIINNTKMFKQSVHIHQNIILWNDFLKKPIPWFMNHPTLCYRKQAFEKVGKYSNNSIIKYSAMEDWELELRFLKIFGEVYNIQEPLLYYRVHNNQNSRNNKHINVNDTRKNILYNLNS